MGTCLYTHTHMHTHTHTLPPPQCKLHVHLIWSHQYSYCASWHRKTPSEYKLNSVENILSTSRMQQPNAGSTRAPNLSSNLLLCCLRVWWWTWWCGGCGIYVSSPGRAKGVKCTHLQLDWQSSSGSSTSNFDHAVMSYVINYCWQNRLVRATMKFR